MRYSELITESQQPGEYVYHASYLPDPARGLRSVIRQGLKPSDTGYAGPGVYFAYDPEGGYYHVSPEEAMMFRVRWADLVQLYGTYPNNKNGIERDDDEIIVPGPVPASMLEVEYFPGEWWDLESAYRASLGPVDENLTEGLYVDVPNEDWLQGKIEYAQSKKRNSFGVPYMGTTTAYTRDDVRVPVDILKRLPGMRGEQKNVRKEDLFAIMKIMKDTGKLPLTDRGKEYAPFINVAWNGEAWVNEGNHRIMAAAALGWKDMPVQISYFDGGERVKDGPMYPGKVIQVNELFQPGKKNWEWARLGRDEVSAFFNVGGREYLWQAFTPRSNPKKWEIQFRLIRKPDQDPDDLDLFGTTGTGNSAEVMSTAVDITRAFLTKYGLDNVEEITFNAKEDSRIGLYAKMIKRLLPDWDLHSKKDPHDGMVFTLTDRRAYDKPENKLSEKQGVTEDLTQGRNLTPETEKYVKSHKWKLTTVNPMDLDTDAFDDPYNRVIDIDVDHPVNFKDPIIVDANGIIIDGFHRAYQAQRQGLKKLPAYAPVQGVAENFADGRVKGKSRPGRVKRAGASCNGSVTDLQARAKKYGGEKGKMYHWCANMKSGRNK